MTIPSRAPGSDWIDPYRTIPIGDVCEQLAINLNGSGFILCPNHSEKNASCRVYQDHVHCYSCGLHADSIGLVQHVRGCDFWGAVRWIAHEFGLPEPRRDPAAQARHEQVLCVAGAYATVRHDALKNPEPALKYLEGRGISRDITTDVVGYLPPNYRPPDPESAKRAGLYSKSGNFLLAGRLIIPVMHHGQIVSLYGRALDDKRIPKHVYPGTTDPPMPAALWGFDDLRAKSEIYLCEGIIDGFTLCSHGFPAVAAFGTNGLSDARVVLLKRSKIERIILVYDSDSNNAGQEGALRAGEVLFRAGYEIQIISLPLDDGATKSDPNFYFQNHTGDDFRALPRRQFFDVAADPLTTAETIGDKKRAALTLVKLVAELGDPLVDSHYLKEIHRRAPDFKLSELEKRLRMLRRESIDHLPTGSDFLPDAYADRILETGRMINFAGEFHAYERGVYRPVPEFEIKRTIQGLGRGLLKRCHIDDAVHSLMVKTAVRPDQVNQPGFLNLENGIIDLTAPEPDLQPHDPDRYCTIRIPTVYDEHADCPRFLAFINQALFNASIRAAAQEVFGYLLVPDTTHQLAFIIYGPTESGKSTLFKLIISLLGPDNVSHIPVEQLGERFMRAQIFSKLANLSGEVGVKSFVEDATVKGIVSGDRMTGENKNQKPFSFCPYARLVIACNELPLSHDVNQAFFRRFLLLPFPNSMQNKPGKNKRLAEEIIENELPGLLLWALAGLSRLRRNGEFTVAQESRDALNRWRRAIDPVAEFREEFIAPVPDMFTSLHEVFQEFDAWVSRTNRKSRFTDANLRQRLENLGIPFVRRKHGWMMSGYVVRPLETEAV